MTGRKKRTPKQQPAVETVRPATPPPYVQYTKSDGEFIRVMPVADEVEVRFWDGAFGGILLRREVFEEIIAQYDALTEGS